MKGHQCVCLWCPCGYRFIDRLDSGKQEQILLQFLFQKWGIYHFTGEIIVICGQIEVSMPTEVKDDTAGFAVALSGKGFVNSSPDSVR